MSQRRMTKKRLKKEKKLVKTERSLKCCRFKDGRVKPEPVYGLCPGQAHVWGVSEDF